MRYGYSRVATDIAAIRPRLVGITVLSPVVPSAAAIAALVKRNDPTCKIVIGGVGASAEPEELLKLYPQFDLAVVGEGEGKVCKVVSALTLNDIESLKAIGDIVYRSGGEVVRTQAPPRLLNVNLLPFVDRSLFSCDPNYKSNSVESFLITSRGCPSNCHYCSIPATWRYARYMRADLVVQEMVSLHHEFGVTDFHFVDDTFTANRKRITEICRLLNDENLDIGWRCTTRCDCVNEEILSQMKAAGCYMVTFGVEVGDDERLNAIGKNTELEVIYDRVDIARRLGILVKGMFMLGFPNETLSQMARTIDVAIGLDVDFAYFSPTKAYPGTVMYQQLVHQYSREQLMSFSRIRLDPEMFTVNELEVHNTLCSQGFDVTKYFKYNEVHDLVVLPDCSSEEFLGLVRSAYQRFYLRRDFIDKWQLISQTRYL